MIDERAESLRVDGGEPGSTARPSTPREVNGFRVGDRVELTTADAAWFSRADGSVPVGHRGTVRGFTRGEPAWCWWLAVKMDAPMGTIYADASWVRKLSGPFARFTAAEMADPDFDPESGMGIGGVKT